jgi:hypothetical protein
VRLRTLSEAECYARCYGGRGEERVSFVRTVRDSNVRTAARRERLQELFEQGVGEREPGREAA